MDQSTQKFSSALLPGNSNIAFIKACWHENIVNQGLESFIEQCARSGIAESRIEVFEVPGSLEIPLQAQLLARTGRYAIIVAAGLIVDGGIYRHDFVASTVLDAMMQVQLETETPILSMVLTPHQFQETEAHEQFFHDHLKIKGREAADACMHTLKNMNELRPA